MKNLDVLIAEGIVCPCGGEVRMDEKTKNPNDKHTIGGPYYQAECTGCGAEIFCGYELTELVIAWYVLTGGPVPGKIKPLYEHAVLVHNAERLGYDREMRRWYGWAGYERRPFVPTPTQWWFYPMHRTPEKIREWLESEHEETT